MTNMLPQRHELNSGPWKALEDYERDLATRSERELFLVAGGLFGSSPPTIGLMRVAVPNATYKIVVALERGAGARNLEVSSLVFAVVMPNRADIQHHSWTDFQVSIDQLELDSGYDFLTNVPRQMQRVVEARTMPLRPAFSSHN